MTTTALDIQHKMFEFKRLDSTYSDKVVKWDDDGANKRRAIASALWLRV